MPNWVSTPFLADCVLRRVTHRCSMVPQPIFRWESAAISVVRNWNPTWFTFRKTVSKPLSPSSVVGEAAAAGGGELVAIGRRTVGEVAGRLLRFHLNAGVERNGRVRTLVDAESRDIG